jgi:hypothetical protein
VERWEPSGSKDPYDDKQRGTAAIRDLQEKFNAVIKQLVTLSDDQLIEPSATPSATSD